MKLIDFLILVIFAMLWNFTSIPHGLLVVLALVALAMGRVLTGEKLVILP